MDKIKPASMLKQLKSLVVTGRSEAMSYWKPIKSN